MRNFPNQIDLWLSLGGCLGHIDFCGKASTYGRHLFEVWVLICELIEKGVSSLVSLLCAWKHWSSDPASPGTPGLQMH